MNSESREILNNARVDWRAEIITREQYEDIVLSVFKAEQEEHYQRVSSIDLSCAGGDDDADPVRYVTVAR